LIVSSETAISGPRKSDGIPAQPCHLLHQAPDCRRMHLVDKHGRDTRTLAEIASGTESLLTLRWSETDSNLYGDFPCQVVVFGLLPVLCSERRGRSSSRRLRSGSRSARNGVKGPKR